MPTAPAGRLRILFTVVLAVVIPAALLIHSRATAYMDTQLARAAVVKFLEALPRAGEPTVAVFPGIPATPEQKAELLKVVDSYHALLRAHNYSGAWELIHPATYGAWKKEEWIEHQRAGGALPEAREMAGMVLLLGRDHQVLDVSTSGDKGLAWVSMTVTGSKAIVLRRREGEWAIDLEGSEKAAAMERIGMQLDEVRGGDFITNMFRFAIADELGVVDPGSLNLSALPLADYMREVTSATVDGDKAHVRFTASGKLFLFLPLKLQGTVWSIDFAGEIKVAEPDESLGPGGTVASPATSPQATACASNLKQLALAMLMYAEDYDHLLPPADRWCDALGPYVKDDTVFHCPADDAPYSYAMNHKLSCFDLRRAQSPATTIALFESEPGVKNACDKGTQVGASLAAPPRHGTVNNFAWLDGHVKALPNDAVIFDYYRVLGKEQTMVSPAPGVPPPPD